MPGGPSQERAGSQQEAGWQVLPIGAAPLPLRLQAVQEQLQGKGRFADESQFGASMEAWRGVRCLASPAPTRSCR